MPTYYCLLGNTPSLSLAELQVLVPQGQVRSVATQVASVELPHDEAAKELMNKVGGTVKILKHMAELENTQPEIVQMAVADAFIALKLPKVTFGIAELGRDHLPPLNLFKIKTLLEKAGSKVRFVEGSRNGLSAAVLLHQEKVIEMNVLQLDQELVIGQTVAIQDIDAWSIRDREKPYADRRKGMLPPKVARMMLNLAISQSNIDQPLVYDPFCGTGTVLIEALTQGCHVVGSDLDGESVEGTKKNLDWFATLPEAAQFHHETAKVFQSDATHVELAQLPAQIDCLVTEPFLGKPQPKPEQLSNMYKGLEKLYLGAFKQWARIMKDGGVVVIVFPRVVSGKHIYGLEGLIDKLASLGYTIASEPLLYHRPLAIVQRQVHIFKYSKI